MSTIYALATPRGKAGLGVVRVSGPDALAAVGTLAGPLPSPRRAGLRTLRAPDGAVLDQALVLTFPQGASYTGETVVELHCHGSPAILDAVLTALSTLPGLRPAEPGEFTRRALENGRMDLAQVEGLADLLEAETEAQRRQAWGVFAGGLSEITEGWRRDLTHALALVEATIDFGEEDVLEDALAEARSRVAGVLAQIEAQIDGIAMSERVRDGFEVALVGPPNSGKSTLVNILSGRQAALVTSVAGTTRDVLELRMSLAGLPVTLLDTAGLRDGGGVVERLGIERARERAARADLRIILLPFPEAVPVLPPKDGDVVTLAKCDRHPGREGVSGLTGEGVDALVARIAAELSQRACRATAFTRHRHRIALQAAAAEMRAVVDTSVEMPIEIAASRLWSAVRQIDAVTGRIDLENVLDDIFSTFCIGK